jgi:iron transport multicopper oxidase
VNVAILRYRGASLTDPSPTADVNIPVLSNSLVESKLRPLVDRAVPGIHELGKADVSYTLRTAWNTSGNGLFTFGTTDDVNETFIPSSVPTLLQILSGVRKAKDLMPQGVVYTLPAHKVRI